LGWPFDCIIAAGGIVDTKDEVGFDGDAYDNGVVRICVGKLIIPLVMTLTKSWRGFTCATSQN